MTIGLASLIHAASWVAHYEGLICGSPLGGGGGEVQEG